MAAARRNHCGRYFVSVFPVDLSGSGWKVLQVRERDYKSRVSRRTYKSEEQAQRMTSSPSLVYGPWGDGRD